jgi:maleylpyruvate isomerase
MRPAVVEVCLASHASILATVAGLGGDDFGHPSLLPGWQRADVMAWLAIKSRSHAHVHRGAVVGELRSQFPSDFDQQAALQRETSRGPDALCASLAAAFGELEAAWDQLPDHSWASEGITTAGPRSMTEIVERHLRDVEVHHVDLDAGYRPSDWPAEFVELELCKRLADLDGP